MRRLWLTVLLSLTYALVAACIGDPPAFEGGLGPEGGDPDDRDAIAPDGSTQPGDSSVPSEEAGVDAGVDAGPTLCGYPGEDCCDAPALPCKAGRSAGAATTSAW